MIRKTTKKKEGISYWQSYSDMMAALLLMFILIMAFTLLQSVQTYQERLNEKEKQLQIQKEQQIELDEQKELLEIQQAQIDRLIGIKADLIKSLSSEFDNTDLKIVVDPNTGAIAFDSSVLFDFGETELKPFAKKFLDEFFPKYFEVITRKEFAQYVSEIIIEGHTDQVGTYIYNLDLSQKRAFTIAQYCLDEENAMLPKDELQELRGLLTANGKSWNNLVYDEVGEVDAEQSRRVVFKFRLKDDEMIEEMRRILEN